MTGKFKDFIATKPGMLGDLTPDKWADFVTDSLPPIMRNWYDPDFDEAWKKGSGYFETARLKLVGYGAFKKSCADAGEALQALKLLQEFFAEENRKAGLGKTTHKPGGGALGSSLCQGSGWQASSPTGGAVVLSEGEIKEMHISKHERNPALRKACIEHQKALHGGHVTCAACNMEFGKVYGEVGEGYIEVHHLNPISQIEGVHEVDPKVDLVPLCANCHAMIHRLMVAEKKATGNDLEGGVALDRLWKLIQENM